MNFKLSDEHRLIQEAARDFATRELAVDVIERDKESRFPLRQVQLMGELGFMGVTIPMKYGGAEMDHLSYVLIIEELAKIDASSAVIVSAHNSLALWGLNTYGTEEQKEKFLKPLAEGKKLGAFALSEPEAGSDASSQHTSARKTEDGYILNGNKNWITNGSSADTYIVIAQTDHSRGSHGISAFIIEKNQPGFTIGPKEDKLGIRSSDTHALHFSDVAVSESQLLGQEGSGFKIAMETLDGGRIGIAAQAVGIAEGAYQLALKYAQERKTFGKPIFKHQAIQFKLSDMATKIQAARLLTYQAAALKDQGERYTKEAAMAKLFASETAMSSTIEAIQIHGGYGYVREYQVERMMRDAKITEIYEGTSEIQKMVIARELLKSLNS
ncbi:MAG TPA: acyl-CoA dehydrogenase [Candidatus Sphingobacterium stercoripullorum]|nr:acyl-CoA dehydrogenase [Candidatus Sphingobacterium stercoripullorum]